MKKVILFIWGIIFVMCFASCNKDTVQPANEKKASTSQPSSTQESPSATAAPGTGCPQSPPPGCPHQPVNPITGMR